MFLTVFRMSWALAKGAAKPALGPLDPCVSSVYCGLRLCDVFGHVNNARYLELFEHGRWEQNLRAGYAPRFWRGKLLAVVGSYHVQYLTPLMPFQFVEVHTQVVGVHAKGLVIEHRIVSRPKKNTIRKTIARMMGLGGKKKKDTAAGAQPKPSSGGFSTSRLRGSGHSGKGKLIAVGVMKTVIIHNGHAVDGVTALEKLGFLDDMPAHVLSNLYFMDEAPESPVAEADAAHVSAYGSTPAVTGTAPMDAAQRSVVSSGDPRTVVGPLGMSEAHAKAMAMAQQHGVTLKPAPSEHILMNRFDDQWRLRVAKERDIVKTTGAVPTAPLLGIPVDRKQWKFAPAPEYDFAGVVHDGRAQKHALKDGSIRVEGLEQAMAATGDRSTAEIWAAQGKPSSAAQGGAKVGVVFDENFADALPRGK